ncbi:Ubiquitin carboxyl-terminal hydrolase 30 [Frankliniella fusca]|uniref:ubiquitinyl hydrolase 1 n=1 Tax=Frankliniella fusca TaxID=407009 RepID=A0AAE1HDT6_9NEOP|nr:Ubiquitin carboxyl-terminal hydrolase 30 [Frankliniella fusca]
MDQERTLLIVAVGVAVAVGCFVLWGPSTFRSRRRKGHVVGLQNLGHTCFLNTLLQALASCPNVIDWLMQHKVSGDGSLVSALRTVLHVLNGEHDSEICDPYAPTEVISALVRHNWVISPGEQDAHELIHVILETLEDEMTSSAKNGSLSDILLPQPSGQGDDLRGPCIINKSLQNGDVNSDGDQHRSSHISRFRPIRRIRMQENGTPSVSSSVDNLPIQTQQNPSPFRGTLTSQLKCTECGFKSALRFDKFDTLSLPLPMPGRKQPLTLQMLLDNFVSTEIIKEVSCSNCSKVQKKPVLTTAMKTLNFGKLPKCLCLHIVRTTWNADGSPWKREDFVDFPEFLVMDNYTHSQVQRNARKLMSTLENGNNFNDVLREPEANGNNTNTATSQKKAEISPPSKAKHIYRLKAVVVHTGDINSGHFITYRKGPVKSLIRHRLLNVESKEQHPESRESARWFYTSDMLVRRAALCDALLSNAYMLFYEKHVLPVSSQTVS